MEPADPRDWDNADAPTVVDHGRSEEGARRDWETYGETVAERPPLGPKQLQSLVIAIVLGVVALGAVVFVLIEFVGSGDPPRKKTAEDRARERAREEARRKRLAPPDIPDQTEVVIINGELKPAKSQKRKRRRSKRQRRRDDQATAPPPASASPSATRSNRAADDEAGGPLPKVIRGPLPRSRGPVSIKVYVTTWCPSCKRAERWLASNNIQHERIDIEKNLAGRQAWLELNPGRSIPTFLIGKRVLVGFSPARVRHLIEQAKR